VKSAWDASESCGSCGNGKISAATITGVCNVTLDAGNRLGDCDETIVLQQSWLWLDGSQGIDPQHCMLC